MHEKLFEKVLSKSNYILANNVTYQFHIFTNKLLQQF